MSMTGFEHLGNGLRKNKGKPERDLAARTPFPMLDQMERRVFEAIVGPDAVEAQDLLMAEKEAVVAKLAGAGASDLERLLARRVAICQLVLADAEYQLSRPGPFNMTVAEHWDKRVSHAQKRLLAAVRTLAEVRRLETRTCYQVNIAEKQINVSGV